jgi:hypothetical protein
MSINILPIEIVRLHRVWTSILYRCNRPDNKQYKNYGGRGITICEEWKDFNQFCFDVGQRPDNMAHLDRTDNDKGYCKENCRWASPKTNHRNKRNNTYFITHLGKMCKSELIEYIGYTRKQFERSLEKYGIEEFLLMFKENRLPEKRVVSDLNDIIGKKYGKLKVLSLDENKSTGARYFCKCDCGYDTRVTRFKLINGLALYCFCCAKRGSKNPNTKEKRQQRNA